MLGGPAIRRAIARIGYGSIAPARGHPTGRVHGWPSTDLILLTWAAGMMDAVSFIRSRVFVANMTGNTVLLGLGFLPPWRTQLPPAAVSLAAFGAGTLIAGLLLIRVAPTRTRSADLSLGLRLELPFVALYSALWMCTPPPAPEWNAFLLLASAAFGLGVQSVAVRRHKVAGVVTTFITGTMTTAILSFLRTGSSEQKPKAPGSTPVLIGMFVSYVLAAAVGGACGNSHRALTALFPLFAIGFAEIRALRAGSQ